MYKHKIVDVNTGEETFIDFTPEEIAEVEANIAATQAEIAAKAQAEAEVQAKRQAAEAKLAALGLEPDDLKALGL